MQKSSPGFKYPVKDKQIKIYSELGPSGTVKHYIHPEGTYLYAYARQLSAAERNAAQALQDASDVEFVINKREIAQDMLVEFSGKTFRIGAPDSFEFYNTEIKFRAYEIAPKTYDTIEYEEEW